jgi:hypothetical protein
MALDRGLTGDATPPLQMEARTSNLPASPFWETSRVPASASTQGSTSQTLREQHDVSNRSSGCRGFIQTERPSTEVDGG